MKSLDNEAASRIVKISEMIRLKGRANGLDAVPRAPRDYRGGDW